MNDNAVLACTGLTKTFSESGLTVDVLKGIDLSLQHGERLAIMGSSGSGKSTLLHMLGGLDKPSSGTVIMDGQDINALNEVERSAMRNNMLGFVYQFHHLLGEFSALENVAMPLLIRGVVLHQ
jgi:lipoprotein-releasing system ATP-binding protein